MQPSDVRSMCCRLRLDLRELRKKTGGFFGSGESTGSIGVVTINMPRIAYQAADEADFYKRLDRLMDISARSLKVKRTVITKLLNEGLYPYTKRYLGTFDNHFSTIGLVGMNEAGLNAKWIGKDMTTPETQEFTKQVLNHMRERLSDYQEMYGDLYNLEATPAESTSYRLAKHDREQFPDILTAGAPGETPYYTNSSHLPVGYTDDVFSALDIQDKLQTLYTSGTVFHCFLGEKLPDWQAAAKLVRTIAENYELPYYTMSPTYSVCTDHGYLTGEVKTCPHCGKPTEVYSRITGYYRPVQNWNEGKSQEYKDRLTYNLSDFNAGRCCTGGGVVLKPEDVSSTIVETKAEETFAAVVPEVAAQTAPAEAAAAAADAAEVIKEAALTEAVAAAAEPIADIAPAAPAEETMVVTDNKGQLLLFTTQKCPNCKLAKEFLSGVDYTVVDAEENSDLAMKYGIMQAPTLVVLEDDKVEKYANASNIRRYVNEHSAK